MKTRFPAFVGIVGLLLAASSLPAEEPLKICGNQPSLTAPEWIRHAVIYEVNVRQYSAAGTFAAVEADLPRIRDLGADVLWFMPVHPIGKVNRKGTLGSPYSVADYLGVNPEFGTEADFTRLVKAAHGLGFRVVMDWVGNHTAWDNPLLTQHPDFFVHDASGKPVPPLGTDWSDVVQLDFGNRAVWDYEASAMEHWIKVCGVDGFRCDFATGLPTDCWNAISAQLRALRPDLFMLAESEVPQQQLRAFHASYSFGMMHVFNDVAAGRAPVAAIDDELARGGVRFPAGGTRIFYTTNHDENSWQGTEFERLGGGVEAFAVLTFVLDGIPLIYNGQEAGLNRRLAFFERDPIPWGPSPLAAFYRTLCALRRGHPALRTGSSMHRVATTANESVYALVREADGRRVVAFCNLTGKDASVEAVDPALCGRWKDVFTGQIVTLDVPVQFPLPAWKYRVLVTAD